MLCAPYSDAFSAIAENNESALYAARKKYSNYTRPTIGFITNSTTMFWAYGISKAITDTLSEYDSERRARNSVLSAQNNMHKRLSSLWSENFQTVFMPTIREANILIKQKILNDTCKSLEMSAEQYGRVIKQKNVLAQIKAQIEAAENICGRSRERWTQQKIETIQKWIDDCDKELASCGFALWGEKKDKRDKLIARKNGLRKEIQALKEYKPLPEEVKVIYNSEPLFDKLCKYKDDDVWTVRFNIADRKYSVYSPGQDLVGSLPSDFTYTYGGYRNICGKNTGHTISWRKRFGMNICEAELTLSIYEIDQV